MAFAADFIEVLPNPIPICCGTPVAPALFQSKFRRKNQPGNGGDCGARD